MTHEEAKAAILEREAAAKVNLCCVPTAEEEALLASGEFCAEELWGGRRPTCPKCIGQEGPVPIGEKYDSVLRPFVNLMAQELHANAHKGDRPGWLKMTALECLQEVYYHVAKLKAAVESKDTAHIAEYAADVANLCMMLTDIEGALGVEKP